jgi:hypothetical protein
MEESSYSIRVYPCASVVPTPLHHGRMPPNLMAVVTNPKPKSVELTIDGKSLGRAGLPVLQSCNEHRVRTLAHVEFALFPPAEVD